MHLTSVEFARPTGARSSTTETYHLQELSMVCRSGGFTRIRLSNSTPIIPLTLRFRPDTVGICRSIVSLWRLRGQRGRSVGVSILSSQVAAPADRKTSKAFALTFSRGPVSPKLPNVAFRPLYVRWIAVLSCLPDKLLDNDSTNTPKDRRPLALPTTFVPASLL